MTEQARSLEGVRELIALQRVQAAGVVRMAIVTACMLSIAELGFNWLHSRYSIDTVNQNELAHFFAVVHESKRGDRVSLRQFRANSYCHQIHY